MSLFDSASVQRLLDRKYGILQQDANAGTMTAQAGMMNARTNAGLLPTQIAEGRSRARLYGVQADQLPMNDAATRRLQDAQSSPIGMLGAMFTASGVGPEGYAKLTSSEFGSMLKSALDNYNQSLTASDPNTSSLGPNARRVGMSLPSTTYRTTSGLY